MELMYLIMLLLCVVALNWRFLGLDRAFGFGGGRRDEGLFPWGKSCSWKRDPTQKDQGRHRYVCRHCGADAFTETGRPPERCLRQARDL